MRSVSLAMTVGPPGLKHGLSAADDPQMIAAPAHTIAEAVGRALTAANVASCATLVPAYDAASGGAGGALSQCDWHQPAFLNAIALPTRAACARAPGPPWLPIRPQTSPCVSRAADAVLHRRRHRHHCPRVAPPCGVLPMTPRLRHVRHVGLVKEARHQAKEAALHPACWIALHLRHPPLERRSYRCRRPSFLPRCQYLFPLYSSRHLPMGPVPCQPAHARRVYGACAHLQAFV